MIAGRPVSLWTGLIGGAVGMLTTIIGATQSPEVAQQWAIILGAVGAFLGLFVAFLAGQPPTVTEGDTVHVVTQAGQPNYTIEATNTPPPAVVTDK